MESDSCTTLSPPPPPPSPAAITLKHQQDTLHSISSASCKNSKPKTNRINEMEEVEQKNSKKGTVLVPAAPQRLHGGQNEEVQSVDQQEDEEGETLTTSLSYTLELPVEAETAARQRNTNDKGSNDEKLTAGTARFVPIINTPRQIKTYSHSNLHPHSSINSFFEESDADFLERGLIGKYDDDNDTPAATANNTPHTEPISSSCIALSPPSIDLGQSSIDIGTDHDDDHDNDDHDSVTNNENRETSDRDDSEFIGKRSGNTLTRTMCPGNKHKSTNDNRGGDNSDYNYKISTPLIPPSSSAALVAAGKNFQSFLPQLKEIAQQQRQQQKKDQCDNNGLMIDDDVSNEHGICGQIECDDRQNSTSSINVNGDDCDNDDTLSPLSGNYSPTIKSTPLKSSMVQSKSYHRRLHETAQFAEAVGELPQDGLIQVIIDDDDVNESDDDDEDEQHHDHNDKTETLESSDDVVGGGLGDVSCNMSVDDDYNQIIVMDSDYPKQKRDDDVVQIKGEINHNASIAKVNNMAASPLKTEVEEMALSSPSPSSSSPTLSPIPKSRPSSTGGHRIFPIDEDCVVPEKNAVYNLNTESKIEAATQQQPERPQKQTQGQKILSSFPTLGLPNLNYFLHHLPCKPTTQSSLAVTSSSTITPSSTTGSSSIVSAQITNNSNTESHYVYKGIQHNPPEITKRGISRGNYAQLHRKAWLEVSDKYHRYGKNLRLYYKHWESLGHPTNMFFEWLDSKGEAAGWEKPDLSECPRNVLDSDRVLYIMDQEAQNRYLLKIKLVETSSEEETVVGTTLPPSSSTMAQIVDCNGNVVRTGPNGWIFVLRDHELYGAEKITRYGGNSKFRFHHSSFFGGKAVAAAGILITDGNGCLKRLYPHSGHYRPGEAHMQRMLFYLYQYNVDLDSFEVDMQQIMHVSREIRDKRTPKGGSLVESTSTGTKNQKNVDSSKSGGNGEGPSTKKAKKTESLHLKNATFVALFLAHKAKLIRLGVLSMIRKIRSIQTSKRSVRNILNVVDEGGFWDRKVV